MTTTTEQTEELPEVLTMPFAVGPHGSVPPVFERLRRERPVARVILPSGDYAWLVTRYQDITRIGSDRRFSRDLTAAGSVRLGGDDFNSVKGGIFNLDPPDHTRVRHVLQRYFSPAAAAALQPVITSHAHQLIDAMQAGPSPVDLMKSYAFPLALHMASELMGVPVEQRRKIVPDLHVQTDWAQEPSIISASTQRLLAFADEVITAKCSEGPSQQDPVNALIQAHDRGEITAEELRGTVMYLFLTSAEPVAGPTAVAAYTLLRHPNILDRVLSDNTDELWGQAVLEVLRYHHNAVSSLPRVATEDVQISGVLIRKGDSVITPWISASCDPEHFKEPEKFRTDRANSEQPEVTFGSGPHFCLGANIARMHLKTALQTLWSRIPGLRLAVKHEDIEWEDACYFFARPIELPVSW